MKETTIRRKGKRGDYRAVALNLKEYRLMRTYCDAHRFTYSDFLGAAVRLGVRERLGL